MPAEKSLRMGGVGRDMEERVLPTLHEEAW